MKRLGFMLAEVLITLGIIGVVAAMTIPVLMTNYQKRSFVSKLQKAISTINQAYMLSYNDLGDVTAAQAKEMGSDAYFNTYWAPYLKGITICKTYKECGYAKSNPWSMRDEVVTNATAAVATPNDRTTFYTPDGILYVVFTGVSSSSTEDGTAPSSVVIVDVNGPKPPNSYGKDTFFLQRNTEIGGKGIQPDCSSYSNAMLLNNCSKSGTGACCAEKIRRDGWKIAKDYPW